MADEKLSAPADTRDIVDDSGPVKGRLAAWALDGEAVLGLCPACGEWTANVGQHIPGLHKMCAACARKVKAQRGVAAGNPLDL